jgi:hypothetical protein
MAQPRIVRASTVLLASLPLKLSIHYYDADMSPKALLLDCAIPCTLRSPEPLLYVLSALSGQDHPLASPPDQPGDRDDVAPLVRSAPVIQGGQTGDRRIVSILKLTRENNHPRSGEPAR